MPKAKLPKQKHERKSREDILNSFMAVTRTDPQTAVYVLDHYEWRFDAAVESFFASQTFYNQPQINARKLEALYDKYKERFQPEKIEREGVVKFLTDLKLDPASLTVLIIRVELIKKKFKIFLGGKTVVTIYRIKAKFVDVIGFLYISKCSELTIFGVKVTLMSIDPKFSCLASRILQFLIIYPNKFIDL